MGLAAKGRQRHQDSHHSLHRRSREKPTPREKNCRRVEAAQQSAQTIPQPPQRDPGQAGRAEEQQIVQQTIQHQHAVEINDLHTAHPLSSMSLL